MKGFDALYSDLLRTTSCVENVMSASLVLRSRWMWSTYQNAESSSMDNLIMIVLLRNN